MSNENKITHTSEVKKTKKGKKIVLLSLLVCLAGGVGTGTYFLVRHFTNTPEVKPSESIGQLAYQEVDGGYKVTGLTNEDKSKVTSITIPTTYKDKQVKSIAKGALKGCANLVDISLPFIGGSDSISNSAEESFFGYVFGDEMYDGAGAYTYQCRYEDDELNYYKFAIPYNLRNVKITGGSYIPAGAFSYCKFLESIEIDNNATYIGNCAFNNCLTLYSFSVPEKITSIEKNAFEMCLTIQNINIPGSVTSIGDNAFTNCISAMSVKIPASVKKIGHQAFHNVNNALILTEAAGSEVEGQGWELDWKDDQANVVYEYKSGGIFYKENFHLALCGEGDNKYLYIIQWIGDWGQATVIIPDTLTVNGTEYKMQVLGARVFEENNYIQTVRMGKNIKMIGANCFDSCSLLNTIDLANVDFIGQGAFKNCVNLRYHFNEDGLKEEGVICENVQVIAKEAFYGCENVRFYRFSNKLTTIGDSAFENNLRLRGEWGLTPIKGGETYAYITKIPYSVTSLGKAAFKNSFKVDDTSASETHPYVEFTQGSKDSERINIESIPESLFEDCGYSGSKTGIYTHTVRIDFWLGNSPHVKKVGDRAYKNCYARRFQGSTGCTQLTEMGEEAFYKTNFLIETAGYAQVSPLVTKLGDRCYYGNTQFPGVSFDIGETKSQLVSIGEDCFAACSNPEFTSIKIPATVTSIGKGAFRSMTYLEEVTFETPEAAKPEKLTVIPTNCFASCSALKKVNILDSVTEIGSSAFSSCSLLTNVELPAGNQLKTIGSSAFASCANLQSIPNLTLTNLSSFGSSVFSGCSNFNYSEEEIGFKDKTNISSSAFQDCLSLSSVKLASNVSAIDSSAFSGCTSLTKIEGTNAKLSIGANAFYNCENLTTISTSITFKSLGDAAFYGCSKLGSITLDSSMSALNANVFAGCTGISSLVLPTSISSASTTPFAEWTSSQSIKFVQKNIKTGTIGAETLTTKWGWTLIKVSGSGQDSVYKCESDGSKGAKWEVNK